MRRIVLAFFFALPALGQVSNPSIIPVSVAPSGACTAGLPNQQVTTTGVQYSCQNGTWGALNAGGSVLPSGTAVPSGLIGWYPLTEPTGTAPVDASGNGNNTTLPGGLNNPTGTPFGWSFSTSGNGSTAQWFVLPSTINTTGVTYVAHACPRFLIDYNNPALVGSNTTGGVVLGFLGATTTKNAWEMSMGLSGTPVTRTAQISVGCHVFTWVMGATDHMYVDGTETTYSAQGSTLANRGIGTLQVGTSYVGGGSFSGILRDLWVFNRALTASEIQGFATTANAIAQQQGVQQYYPINSATSSVVCLGDSITVATSLTSFCSASLLAPTETIAVTNQGLVTYTMAGIAGTAVLESFPSFAANGLHNTATLFACTNDFVTIPNAVTSAAICQGLTVKAATLLRRSGRKVILIPMLSRTAQDTNKNSLDTLYNANWQSIADAYVSPTDANLWADGASANATYFQGDATHPTQAGQNLLGTYVTNAYNKLYGSTATSWNTTAIDHTITAADSYLIVTANSTQTLPSCKGYSGTWSVKVNPGLTVALKTATAAETIDGTDYSSSGLALTAGTTNAVTVVPAAPATATCTWTKSL